MPARLALLDEGAQALLALVAGSSLGDPAFGPEPVGPLEDELFGVASRFGAGRAQLLEQAVDRFVQVVGELVDEPDPQGRLRVEALTGDEVAPGRAGADLGQRVGRDDRRDDPELDLR